MGEAPTNAQLAAMGVRNAVGNVDWKGASETAKTKAYDAFLAVRRGDVSTQVLCFAGGVALFVHAVLNIINIFNSVADPFMYVFNFYMALFGFITAIYEWPATCNAMGMEERMKIVHTATDIWFKVFTSLIGRGLIYVAVGILASASSGMFSSNGIIGLYMIFCGVVLLLWNWKVRSAWAHKIETLKKDKVDASKYKDAFPKPYGMSKLEFSTFMEKKLDMELHGEELNIAFRYMDANDSGCVTYEEFKNSYDEGDSYNTWWP